MCMHARVCVLCGCAVRVCVLCVYTRSAQRGARGQYISPAVRVFYKHCGGRRIITLYKVK